MKLVMKWVLMSTHSSKAVKKTITAMLISQVLWPLVLPNIFSAVVNANKQTPTIPLITIGCDAFIHVPLAPDLPPMPPHHQHPWGHPCGGSIDIFFHHS